MGNHYSDMKNTLTNSNSIPKHLKPSTSCSPIQHLHRKNSSKKSSKQTKTPAKVAVATGDKLPSTNKEEEKTVSIGSGSFQWYKGRRYYTHHNRQILPNDQAELDRLGVLNFVLRWAFKGYIVAPIHEELLKGIDVLNVGYGPGLWSGHHVIDVALDFKNSRFMAIDIMNLLPEDFDKFLSTNDPKQMHHLVNGPLGGKKEENKPVNNKVLENLSFQQCNVVESGLPFEDNTFDFVKQQLATTSFTIKDWIHSIKEIVRVTKPGGYIQLIEVDYHISNLTSEGDQWEASLLETTRERTQLEPRMATYISDMLEFIGLIDVSSRLVSIPIGSWGLDIGEMWKKNHEMFIEATSLSMCQIAGMTAEEYRDRWKMFMSESLENKPFSNLHAAYGRKPLKPLDLDHIDWSTLPPFASIF